MKGWERANNVIYSAEQEIIGDALSTPLRPCIAEELAKIAEADFCMTKD